MKIKNIIFILLLLLLCPNLIFAINPEKKYRFKPTNYNLNYTELKIKVDSLIYINVWDFASNQETSKETIIITGGDAGNMGYLIEDAKNLISLGYHVITFDYRGFGGSSDFNIRKNQLYYDEFSDDLTSVIIYAKKKYINQKIGILAFSMGTIISFITYQKEHYDFFIGDGVIINPNDIIKRIREVYKREMILPINSQYKPTIINNIKIPMLLYAGKYDLITTVADCNSLIKNYNIKRIVITYEGGHLSGYKSLNKAYFINIKNFIKNRYRI